MAARRNSKPKRAYLRDWEIPPEGVELSTGRRGGRYFEYRKGDYPDWFRSRPLLVKSHDGPSTQDGHQEVPEASSSHQSETRESQLSEIELAVRESERVLKEVGG